jgi:hypothetical protein
MAGHLDRQQVVALGAQLLQMYRRGALVKPLL